MGGPRNDCPKATCGLVAGGGRVREETRCCCDDCCGRVADAKDENIDDSETAAEERDRDGGRSVEAPRGETEERGADACVAAAALRTLLAERDWLSSASGWTAASICSRP